VLKVLPFNVCLVNVTTVFYPQKALDKMDDQAPTLVKMNELGESLVEKTNAPEVKTQMTNTNEDHDQLQKRLNDAKQTLDEIVEHSDEFDLKKAEVDKKLPKLQEKVEALEPISARPNTVKKQLQESENISKEVCEVVEALESVQDDQDWLFENTEVEPEVSISLLIYTKFCSNESWEARVYMRVFSTFMPGQTRTRVA
jgi:predicted nuclease with TOPRIM domain